MVTIGFVSMLCKLLQQRLLAKTSHTNFLSYMTATVIIKCLYRVACCDKNKQRSDDELTFSVGIICGWK